jgi:glutathione reductase (NADPH)
MDSETHFDYIVIGAGSGGVGSARWTASKHGTKVAIIEHQRLGGTCVNVGCVPKKVMFNTASYIEDCHVAKDYGFSGTENVKLDFPSLKKGRDDYVAWLNGTYTSMLATSNVHLIRGWAKFVDNKTIEVDEADGKKRYTANHILIATGSTPNKIGFEGEEHSIDSDGFFDIEELPKKVVVLGGGYIATELGQILHTFGTHVIQVVRSKVLGFIDSEVTDVLEKRMEISGYDIRKNLNISKVEKVSDLNHKVTLSDGTVEEDVNYILVAAGRPANIVGLGLETTDIKLGKRGEIEVDEFQNTSVENVYAIGDVTGKWELTPVAIKAGRTLAERLFNNRPDAKMDYSNIPTVIFSHPPIGTIGMTEQQAKDKFGEENVACYKSSYVNMFYSLMKDKDAKPRDFIKYVVNKADNERLVGLHLIGRNVDEMLQGASIAIKMGATKKDFDSCVAIHPTGSEELVLCDPYV